MELMCWLKARSLVTQNAAANFTYKTQPAPSLCPRVQGRLQLCPQAKAGQPLSLPKKRKKKVQDMEMLGWLNAGSLVMRHTAAGSLDFAGKKGKKSSRYGTAVLVKRFVFSHHVARRRRRRGSSLASSGMSPRPPTLPARHLYYSNFRA